MQSQLYERFNSSLYTKRCKVLQTELVMLSQFRLTD